MKEMHSSKRSRIFYGYWIAIAASIAIMVSYGCLFYTFSLFIKPLQGDFGWSRGAITGAFATHLAIIAVASPFIGRLVDRYGVRKIMLIGALLTGLCLILLSRVTSLWHLYAAYIGAGIGGTAVGIVPATTVVLKWFRKGSGLATGITTSGLGAGGFVMAPIVGGYLIPAFGWRGAYSILALIGWVVIIPLVLFVIREKPADKGLYPYGIETPEAEGEAMREVPEGITLRMTLGTLAYWLIQVTFLTSVFSQAGVVQSAVPHLQDIGFPVAVAFGALSGAGLGAILGRLGFGVLCDRMQVKYATCIGLGIQVVGIIILLSVRAESPVSMIWLYSLVFGFGYGSKSPATALLASQNFGLAHYGAIFGTMNLVQSFSAATSPLFGGLMYDAMNTYYWAFIVMLALYVVAIPAILLVHHPKSLPILREV